MCVASALVFTRLGDTSDEVSTASAPAVDPMSAGVATVALPAEPGPVPAAIPTAVSIPAIGLNDALRVIPAGGCPVIDPPTLTDVFWVGCRAKPGTDSDGTTVLTGHAVAGGSGVFNELGDLRNGDAVYITTPRGRLEYRVATQRLYRRNAIALSSQMTTRMPGHLLLVTCYLDDGRLTGDNLVVEAHLVSAIPV